MQQVCLRDGISNALLVFVTSTALPRALPLHLACPADISTRPATLIWIRTSELCGALGSELTHLYSRQQQLLLNAEFVSRRKTVVVLYPAKRAIAAPRSI